MRYLNFFFMLSMAMAYAAMLYIELQTSSQRTLSFSEEGLEFSSIHKHFFFKNQEIKQVRIDDSKITIKFSDHKFLQFILAESIPENTKLELQNRYSS